MGQGENRGTAGTARVNKVEPPPKMGTRIQRKNRRAITEAALEVFSAQGYRGATVDAIAARAGMSKPNLLYYFPTKEAIYVAVLEDTLAEWLQPLAELDPDGEPIAEIGRYIGPSSRCRAAGRARRSCSPTRSCTGRRRSARSCGGR
jgi:TetR/AcrR family transcriptional regulator